LVDEKTPRTPGAPEVGADPNVSSEKTGGQARPSDPPGAPERAAGPTPPKMSTADKGAPADAAQSPETPQAPPAEPQPPSVVVRYGSIGLVGRFTCTLEEWKRGQQVVIKSDRGQELGAILCPWRRQCAAQNVAAKMAGDVLRVATHADEIEGRHLQEGERRMAAFCKEQIAARKLPMKLVAVEHLFGGDRIIFYFLAESRVDFRSLVRDLAHEFQTRIEMRQIGARDEARLMGDYERCGRPLCCRAWIKDLAPVSMRMAKMQKATLDPTKISGQCGRLMCCLRFEHATYSDLAKRLPRRNSYVATPDGVGKVVDTAVVTQIVGVQLESGARVNVPVESLLERDIDPQAVSREPKKEVSPPPPVKEKSEQQEAANEKTAAGESDAPSKPRRGGKRSRRRGRRRNRKADHEADDKPERNAEKPNAGQGD